MGLADEGGLDVRPDVSLKQCPSEDIAEVAVGTDHDYAIAPNPGLKSEKEYHPDYVPSVFPQRKQSTLKLNRLQRLKNRSRKKQGELTQQVHTPDSETTESEHELDTDPVALESQHTLNPPSEHELDTDPVAPESQQTLHPPVADGHIVIMEPFAIAQPVTVKVEAEDAPLELKNEHDWSPPENMAGDSYADDPSSSTQTLGTLPAKELYEVHLQRKIRKSDMEMELIKHQVEETKLNIKKASLEIELLEHQLKEIKKQ
ncbi:hypothetical protein DPEC_G00051120 [Dallia pectoralis]|uniref:Uncharacterized protein n=1 Tax=Dallia pectoralis TaxID=75939 RepID=A0ACC2HBG0_DALPE|nr:hypothetical protein DPEC_G00051120 [Dallia pectoralis]